VVAINFQPEFAPLIETQVKTQTIRRSARAETGDTLQLYTGQRTKACRLIGTATCQHCEPITIAEDHVSTGYHRLSSGDADAIAKRDGFESVTSLKNWFRARYGLPFEGHRIMWHEFKPNS
jgi:hypothetical protein